MSPNDPKLSDGRGWRDRCEVGKRRRQEAAGVTSAPVRCSAWLGVAAVANCPGCGAEPHSVGWTYRGRFVEQIMCGECWTPLRYAACGRSSVSVQRAMRAALKRWNERNNIALRTVSPLLLGKRLAAALLVCGGLVWGVNVDGAVQKRNELLPQRELTSGTGAAAKLVAQVEEVSRELPDGAVEELGFQDRGSGKLHALGVGAAGINARTQEEPERHIEVGRRALATNRVQLGDEGKNVSAADGAQFRVQKLTHL